MTANEKDFELIKKNEDFSDGYYHLTEDLLAYPDAWCYVIWSARGPGKTTSACWAGYYLKKPFIYIKRTNDDIKLICGANQYGFDPSPYAVVNRLHGCNVKAFPIEGLKGMGFFARADDEGQPQDGQAVGTILSMNYFNKVKGADFSNNDWIVFDEFIPQAGSWKMGGDSEGTALLDLYKTVQRDRTKRGLPEPKLILFANAESIESPITNVLEITDNIAEMTVTGTEFSYIKNRGILLHWIRDVNPSNLETDGIYKAMAGTAWGRKTFEGEFSNNDFTMIVPKKRLTNMFPLCSVVYQNRTSYLYQHKETGEYRFCFSGTEQPVPCYDMAKVSDVRRFYIDFIFDIKNAIGNRAITFQTYSLFEIIKNYTQKFKVI